MKKRLKLNLPRETVRHLTDLGNVRGGAQCSTSGYTKYDCDPPIVAPAR